MFLHPNCRHSFREVQRYVAYTAASTNAPVPPDAPVTVVQECVLCGGRQTHDEPQPKHPPSSS
jgi:hypothetical protein